MFESVQKEMMAFRNNKETMQEINEKEIVPIVANVHATYKNDYARNNSKIDRTFFRKLTSTIKYHFDVDVKWYKEYPDDTKSE